MKYVTAIIITCICILTPVFAAYPQSDNIVAAAVRFAPLHIYIDSGNEALAAFQFELKATTGQVKIVGIEGGEHEAFKQPPYYDPAALANDRVIIAAFNTGQELPTGRTRVATIHLQIIGEAEPDYELDFIVAANGQDVEISANIDFEKGD